MQLPASPNFTSNHDVTSKIGRPRLPGRPAAFTLVELLVVIGIIAVLISILLPSLAKARANARAVACMSNLHQIYVAFGCYLIDNKGQGTIGQVLYPTVPGGLPAGTTVYQQFWFASYITTAGKTTFDATQGYLTRYFKDPRIFNCPVLADLVNTAPLNTGFPTVGYGYNTQTANASSVSARNGQIGIVRFAQIRNPTDTMALLDIGVIATGGQLTTQYASNEPGLKIPSFAGRHNGQGNVLWYDGHVTPQRPYLCSLATSYGSTLTPYIGQYLTNHIGYLTPATPLQNPESTLVFTYSLTQAPPVPINLNYYYSLNKSLRE